MTYHLVQFKGKSVNDTDTILKEGKRALRNIPEGWSYGMT